MASTTAISSQTAAATSSDITLADGSSIQIWTSPALESDESVTLWRTAGGSPDDAVRVQESGWYVQLDPSHQSISLAGPGTFRLKKSVTATATTVYYDA